jgi:hypothetical protein
MLAEAAAVLTAPKLWAEKSWLGLMLDVDAGGRREGEGVLIRSADCC